MVKKKRKKQKVSGLAWHQDRKRESQEPWEKRYKKKSSGLAYASNATRKRVARLGGKASAKKKKRR